MFYSRTVILSVSGPEIKAFVTEREHLAKIDAAPRHIFPSGNIAEHAAGRMTRPLRHNGQPYSGINNLSLLDVSHRAEFRGAHLDDVPAGPRTRRARPQGEKGSLVVCANSITRTEHDEKSGEDVEREIPYMKGYTVFNVEQIDGLPEIYYAKAPATLDTVARIGHAEKFLHATGARISHGGHRAYYSHSTDTVQMPPFESFRDADSYYSTLPPGPPLGRLSPKQSPRYMVFSKVGPNQSIEFRKQMQLSTQPRPRDATA
jgi:hypothetical protein